MEPINFSKFAKISKEYGKKFDFDEIVNKLNSLRPDFYIFSSYIDLLTKAGNLKKIVLANNIQLFKWKDKFDATLKFDKKKCLSLIITKNKNGTNHEEDCKTCCSCNYNQNLNLFSDKIIDLLGYNRNARTYLRLYYSELDLKACYICNAQYALSIDPEDKDTKSDSVQSRHMSKFQFDHFLPKSIYPCFSISLYNLLPICSGCNSIKNNDDIGINYLSNDMTIFENAFKFKLVESSLTSFLLNNEKLKIDFIDNYSYHPGVKKISDRFDLKGIYNTQTDIIEELIHRKLKYSETYKQKLSNSFPKIFSNTSIEERILLGTYTKKDGIQKRPMSKFTQDINTQLDEYFEAKIKSLK
jgi:hypothetical protein